ncbi:MAG: lipocalin [Azorhizobium sp. 39-67-5]|nr:MAG: lipocalin [Azorhizobium sp. 39-67-5]
MSLPSSLPSATHPPTTGGILHALRAKAWSPYAAGILIGLLQVPAFLLIETALGASSSYVTVGGLLASLVDPMAGRIDYVAKHIALTPKNWWQVALVVGIALGAFASMRISGARRHAVSPVWQRALGTSSPVMRYALAFGAGFLMLFGARIADGCTSGHGLSGMAQMAVSSTLAVTFMFVGGIATALLVLRRI